jgi:hypothetical protein
MRLACLLMSTRRQAGLSPRVFIGPLLPLNPAKLHELLSPYAGRVMLAPLN